MDTSEKIWSYTAAVYKGWRVAANVVGTIFGSLVFGFVYIFVVGLYAIADRFRRKEQQEPKTFWHTKTIEPITRESMIRPF